MNVVTPGTATTLPAVSFGVRVAVKFPAPSRMLLPTAPPVIEPPAPVPTTCIAVPSAGTAVFGMASVETAVDAVDRAGRLAGALDRGHARPVAAW